MTATPSTLDPYRAIIEVASRCKRILVTTHVRPDGDALGTCVALILGLRKVGIDAELLVLSKLPRKYAFVVETNKIICHDADKGWPEKLNDLSRFDAFVSCDTGTWSQLPGLKDRILNWKVPKLVIDHHLTQEDWATTKLVITEASAAGEIVAELLDQWDIPIDTNIGSAIFLAIASDTGWFQFANTRPYTLRLAARLMEVGVDTDKMYQLLFQNERAERVALQTRAQQSLELLADGRLAVMQVRKSDFEETRADVPDTENLINIPLQIQTVQASILLTEPKDGGAIRVSLRSKGQVDVARFAEKFGGGGHARASGLRIEGTLKSARDKVVTAMVEALGNQ
ncbi:DHH family phosphoesterase [Humisphaera borealis]|uniref:Bifunctional oligoribonuclease/PAP phosphatase NrnA n=1 Tax=Humisphaera borealis TaxID=2807512 RepID=A0A7M2WZQ7_9BACT|nr:bifunctional oligoribonuclease/PAP phosphatase NrnA [Humisphaera borealis]QOV90854.1 bifunctional oligoribonuclease/PAP phosphatase NrnA [Humisphaera borealis]